MKLTTALLLLALGSFSSPKTNVVTAALSYWVPPLDEPGISCEHKRIKIPNRGEYTCIPVGGGICRDNGGKFGKWLFGVAEVEDVTCTRPQPNVAGGTSPLTETIASATYPVLFDPATNAYPVSGTTYKDSDANDDMRCKNDDGEAVRGCNYADTTHICIGETIDDDPNRYSEERPYLFFYNEKTQTFLYQLVCDGIGTEGKLPQMKMMNNEDLAFETYVKYPVDIVKYKKGFTADPTDANELWKMSVDWNGYEDPATRRIGKLAANIGVANPQMCTEYVGETSTACWENNCDSGPDEVPTSSDAPYETDTCPFEAAEVCDDCWCLPDDGRGGTCPEFDLVSEYNQDIIDFYRNLPLNGANPHPSNDCYPNLDHIDLTGSAPLVNIGSGDRIPVPFLPGFVALPECSQVKQDYDNAVCGFKYKDAAGLDIPVSSCDDEILSTQPSSYDIVTYPSRQAAEADGAFISHVSACGTCSSAQDLSVFLDQSIDVVQISFLCFAQWAAATQAGQPFDLTQCVADATGFTTGCAESWAINIYFNSLPPTAGPPPGPFIQYPFSCRDTCLALQGQPRNNPDCTINACFQCDEEVNVPSYTQIAGRYRRNSGIITDITRSCNEIVRIRQDLMCNL